MFPQICTTNLNVNELCFQHIIPCSLFIVEKAAIFCVPVFMCSCVCVSGGGIYNWTNHAWNVWYKKKSLRKEEEKILLYIYLIHGVS